MERGAASPRDGGSTGVPRRGAGPAARLASDWLALAAAPTFAAMAVLAARAEGEALSAMCMGSGGSPLSGMAVMYALMAVFHAAPWMKLLVYRGEHRHASLGATAKRP